MRSYRIKPTETDADTLPVACNERSVYAPFSTFSRSHSGDVLYHIKVK